MIAPSKLTTPRVGLFVAVVTVLALTACGPIKTGSAAVVGNESLSEASVADAVDEINTVEAATGQQGQLPADQVTLSLVARWVDAQLTRVLAAEKGVTVTGSELDAALSQYDDKQRAAIAAQYAIPPSQFDLAVETLLLQQKLGQLLAPTASPQEQSAAFRKALGVTAAAAGVSVNPRYGSWDPSLAGVQPRSADRLSMPADGGPPVATPSPSAS